MSSAEIESRLRRGPVEWNRWREKYQLATIDLSGVQIENVDLHGANLTGVNFSRAYLPGARFDRADLRGVNFASAQLQGARFVDADLRNAVFSWADLRGVEFTRADLRGVDLREAELAGSTWAGARISRKTRIHRVRFDPSHRALNDGSDTLVIPYRDRMLNWGVIRVAGALPLFEVSYLGVTGAILMITTVGYINERGFVTQWLSHIPLPNRVLWLLLSSFLLFVGSSIYRLACPPRIQEFSETQWVEQNGRPRIQYLSASTDRRWQFSTALFLFTGGLLGVVLLFERFYVAFQYVMEELQL